MTMTGLESLGFLACTLLTILTAVCILLCITWIFRDQDYTALFVTLCLTGLTAMGWWAFTTVWDARCRSVNATREFEKRMNIDIDSRKTGTPNIFVYFKDGQACEQAYTSRDFKTFRVYNFAEGSTPTCQPIRTANASR